MCRVNRRHGLRNGLEVYSLLSLSVQLLLCVLSLLLSIYPLADSLSWTDPRHSRRLRRLPGTRRRTFQHHSLQPLPISRSGSRIIRNRTVVLLRPERSPQLQHHLPSRISIPSHALPLDHLRPETIRRPSRSNSWSNFTCYESRYSTHSDVPLRCDSHASETQGGKILVPCLWKHYPQRR